MINVVIESREHASSPADPAPEAEQPPVDEAELIAETPKGAPPGSLSHRVPPPGKQEDAFEGHPLGEPTRPNRNAIAEP